MWHCLELDGLSIGTDASTTPSSARLCYQTKAIEMSSRTNFRKYGRPPLGVVVVHGGPGAPGCMAPVARELSGEFGVLEPLQSADSIEGQLEELRDAIVHNADPPVVLVGSSWGAMLALLFAARYPRQTGKLILVGSGVFEDSFAEGIQDVRLDRLDPHERREAEALNKELQAAGKNADKAFARLAVLFAKTDAYDPLTLDTEILQCQYRVYRSVWREAQELRRRGGFLKDARDIRCPVVAIHGDYDPHPPAGVEEPLSRCLDDFRFVVLKNCGHLPWIERQAKESFYAILREECRMPFCTMSIEPKKPCRKKDHTDA